MNVSTVTESGHDPITTVSVLFLSFQVPSPEIGWLVLLLIGVGLPVLCWLLYLWVRSDIEVEGRLDPVTGQDEPIADYLERLDQGLRLPAGLRRDVLAEIAGHLSQSVATLEADGATHADAVREALRRLGPPEPLARDLRSAQQTTRRLIAGVGGGVFGATAGLGVGLLFGALALLPAVLFSMLLTTAINALAHTEWTWSSAAATSSNLLFVDIAMVVTGRVVTRLSAGLARRELRPVAWVVTAIGVPIVAALTVGQIRQEWTWLGVPFAVALPVCFAAGALTADRAVRWPSRRLRLVGWLALGTAYVAIPVLLGAPSVDARIPPPGIERVAPPAPAAFVPQTAGAGTGLFTSCWSFEEPAIECTVHGVPSVPFTDLRLEAWPGEQDFIPDGPDPRATAPLAVAPMVAETEKLTGTVDAGFHRSGNAWWLVVTGVGPDGVRYRITDGYGETFDWSPTLLEWLAAPD